MKNQPKTASKSTCPSSCSVYIANLYFREGVKQIAFLSMEELEDFRARHIEITGDDDQMTVTELPLLRRNIKSRQNASSAEQGED